MNHKLPTRDDYYRICISRGAPKEDAARIADGLVAAQARKEAGLPGWEKLVGSMPRSVADRSAFLYGTAVISHPSEDPEAQGRSGLQAVLSYGIFVGMGLAEGGHLMSEAERGASHESMPDVWEWIETLSETRETKTRPSDD